MGEPATLKVIAALKHPDPDIRYNATSFFDKVRDTRAVPALIDLLNDEDADVRAAAAGKLGGVLSDRRAIEPLIKALQDEDEDVRASSALSLGQLPDVRAREPLIQVLKDSYSEARGFAAYSLGQLGGNTAPYLLDLLEDEDDMVRLWTLQALMRQDTPPVVRAVVNKLSDPNARVRENAAQTLNTLSLNDAAIDALLKTLDDPSLDVRYEVIETLGWSKNPRVLPVLQSLQISDTDKTSLNYSLKEGVLEAIKNLEAAGV